MGRREGKGGRKRERAAASDGAVQSDAKPYETGANLTWLERRIFQKEGGKMDEATATFLKQAVGITDEDLAKVQRNIEKIFSNASAAMQYKVVAEVTSSKYCFAGIKVGDKIVFSPFLNPQETTCPLCPRALLPVLVALQQFWERTFELFDRGIEGIDDLNNTAFAGIAGCLDPGLEHGGLGHVSFKLYAEEVGQ